MTGSGAPFRDRVIGDGRARKQRWDRLLYNQTAKRLKAVIVGREHTRVADVPYERAH